MTVHLCSTVPMGEDLDQVRRRLVRPGARHDQRVGQRCLAAADRAGCQPAGHGHGVGHPQRPSLRGNGASSWLNAFAASRKCTVVTGAAGWLGRALVDRLLADPTRRRLRLLAHTTAEARCAGSARRRQCGRGRDRRHRQARHRGAPAARNRSRRRRDPHRRDHPSDVDAAVLRGQRQRHAPRRRGGARPRRATAGARVVEQPVRHQPAARATRSGRRAVQPVLRLRPIEDAGRAGGLRGDRARPRRDDRAAAVVLRSVPAATADDVLPAGPRRQVPGRRRRRAAPLDGLRRQPRRRRASPPS